MSMLSQYACIATKSLRSAYSSGDAIEKVIISHATAAAGAGIVSGIVPGAGSVAATAAATAAVWSMYIRLNKEMGIKLSKNVMKTLASAAVSNIVVNLGGIILADIAAAILSLIPGVGSAASSLLMAAADYGMAYVAGLLYIKLIDKMTKSGKDFSNMSEEELKNFTKKVYEEDKEDYAQTFKNARAYAKSEIKNGNIKPQK